jgi:hypothetical protein
MAVTITKTEPEESTLPPSAEQPAVSAQRPAMRLLDLVGNVAVLGALWVLYRAVRGVTAEDYSVALGHAREVIDFQRSIGLPSESVFQRDLLEQTGLLRMANIYYIAAHFPVTIGFLAYAWAFHRHKFARIRNTLVAVSAVGMVIHLLYPLAPPRMLGWAGFVDTAARFGPSPYDLGIAAAANQIAAMPSLHVGWALLVCIGAVWIFDSRWRWLAAIHPAITTIVVVLTANHYWIDAFIAAALVGVVWTVHSARLHRVLSWV